MLRRIEGAQLLQLFDIPVGQPGGWADQPVPVRLERWVRDGTFRAFAAGSEFELTVLSEPKILVTLIRRASPPPNPVLPTPEPVRQASELPAPARIPSPRAVSEPPPSSTGGIHRWVDAQGVVHYSDRPAVP
jgi:hypothetical protein